MQYNTVTLFINGIKSSGNYQRELLIHDSKQNEKVTKIIQFVDSNLPWPPSFFRFAASNDPCPEIGGTLPTRRVIFLKCKGTQSVNRKGKFQGICIITY